MYRGISIELNALGEGWRCRKWQKLGYCMFGSRQGIPGRDGVQEMPRIGYCWFWVVTGDSWSQHSSFLQVWVAIRVFLVAIEPPGSMSRHGFPYVATWFSVLSCRKCRNMAFLCCDRVTGSLS